MRVVITGGLGFIGQNLARYLRRRRPGMVLTAIDWASAPDGAARAAYDRVHRGDFAAREALAHCERADAVIHLAAQSRVQTSITQPHGTFVNNVLRSEALLDHLRRRAPEAQVVFASTGAIGNGHIGGGAAGEAGPLSPYAASKLAVEALLSSCASSYGMPAVSLRFANVYGPHSERQGGLIPASCRLLLEEGALQVNGDGLQTRDYVYVDDICAAIEAVIDRRAGGVYQLGTGTASSVLDVIGHFGRLVGGRPLRVDHGPAQPGELRHHRADTTRAREDLSFVARCGLAEGIARTYAWYRIGEGRQVA